VSLSGEEQQQGSMNASCSEASRSGNIHALLLVMLVMTVMILKMTE
jgi:hypothetical protein